ncbi:hypothetical protein [Streptomyces griseorubiginosus]
MTAADWIAAAILTAFALLITHHQHHENRSTTEAAHPQDGEPRT